MKWGGGRHGGGHWEPTLAPINSPTLSPTLNLVPKSFLGQRYCDMSLIMAQSAFRCSLLETFCSASSGSVLTAGLVAFRCSLPSSCDLFSLPTVSGPTLSSDGLLGSDIDADSFWTVRTRASSFLCRGVEANMRLACHEAWIWIWSGGRVGLEEFAACGRRAARRHPLLVSIVPHLNVLAVDSIV